MFEALVGFRADAKRMWISIFHPVVCVSLIGGVLHVVLSTRLVVSGFRDDLKIQSGIQQCSALTDPTASLTFRDPRI